MKTARMAIEVLRPLHAEVLFADARDERIYTYIPEPRPESVDALRARYEELAAGARPGSKERWLNWVMFETTGGAPVGLLQATVLFEERRSYVAYTVFPRYWKQGYATEGLAWLLDHLRTHEAVELVEAHVDVRNEASRGVVQRLGFDFTRTIRSPECVDNVFLKRLIGEPGVGVSDGG